MTRNGLIAVAACAAVLVALVPVGRWERERRADAENRGMRKVQAAVGPLDSPSLWGFRIAPFDCLVYKRGPNPYALEICVDRTGRVIEAIDRRANNGHPKIWSLRDDPTRSTVRVDRAEVNRLLERMGVPARLLPPAREGSR